MSADGTGWWDSPSAFIYNAFSVTPVGALLSSDPVINTAEAVVDDVTSAPAVVTTYVAARAKEAKAAVGAAAREAGQDALDALAAAKDALLPWWALPAAGVALLVVAGFVAMPYVTPYLRSAK